MTGSPGRDRITVSNIRLNPKIGVTPGERRIPQCVFADVTMWGNFGSAAETDQLERTVNYSKVLETVEEVAGAQAYNLLETLAHRIGSRVLNVFPIDRVSIQVRKTPKSLAGKADHVEVEIQLPCAEDRLS